MAVVAAGLLLGLGALRRGRAPAFASRSPGPAVGWAYDIRLKTTGWAWLPFAVGLPLLPVFAWVGATGRIPAAFGLLVPLAIVAGAGVALLNGLADIDRDRAAGVATPVVRLGARRARRLSGGLLGLVGVGAVGSLAAIGAEPGAWLVEVVGLCLVGGRPCPGRLVVRGPPRARLGGGAIGLGVVAAGWVLGLAGRGLL